MTDNPQDFLHLLDEPQFEQVGYDPGWPFYTLMVALFVVSVIVSVLYVQWLAS